MDFYKDANYSLSEPQKRIWYVEKVYPDTSINNIGGFVKIKGEINFELLQEAIQKFIRQNEGIRLELYESDGEIRQYVKEYLPFKIPFYDFTAYENPSEAAYSWLQSQFRKAFKLLKTALFEFMLIKINENENGFFVKLHHITSDGWTIQLMTQQITSTYMQLKLGTEGEVDAGYSYIDYLQQEQEYLKSPRFEKDKAFWKERFSNLPEMFLQKSSDSLQGARKTFMLHKSQTDLIRDFAEKNNISLNTLFVCFIMIYLHKSMQQNDIIIGNPVLNRSTNKQKKIAGMFTSTMPFRMNIDEKSCLLDFIQEVNSEIRKYLFHQKYPYNFIIGDIDLYEMGKRNLFQIVLNYYNTRLVTELDGLVIENEEFYNGYQTYSLQIVVKDWSSSGELELQFDYKIDDYTEVEIERLFQQLVNLINNLLNHQTSYLDEIQLVSDNEIDKLVFKNNNTVTEYPKDQTIVELIEAQVEKTPDAIAVSFKDDKLSYDELNKRSNQLARMLVNRGLKSNDFVGIMVEHSLEMILSILAVLKVGAVYVPIDPDYPVHRINYIIKDSNTKFILTNFDLMEGLQFDGEFIHLNSPLIYSGNNTNLAVDVSRNDPVYIIYTSGSTGNPKGTIIHQQGLVNYIWWAKDIYLKNTNDVFALYSSISFDLTVTSIFAPLITGNEIKIYKENEDEFVLHQVLRENEVTVIKLTPAHLSLIKNMDNSQSSVKRFIVGGEDLKSNLAFEVYQSFHGDIEIYNEYGPTETVVGCMIYKFHPKKDVRASVPIGKPIHNVQIYVLDKNLMPVPVGVQGEIYISGDGVAIGYLNKPELTSNHFIDNPFIKGNKMYKTGDLAVYLDDYNLEYIGRTDTQVKIKGYRIELNEIENQLLQIQGVIDAVVIDQLGMSGEKYLSAYLVMKDDVSILNIKAVLTERMPSYMIPVYFKQIDKIPLSVNGKVDRKALPDPTLSVSGSGVQNGNEVVEEILLQVVKEIFTNDGITLEDNFYHLGGDSIKAIQIVSKLNNNDFRLKVKDILNYPIFKELSYVISTKDEKHARQAQAQGSVIPTPIIEWFFMQQFSNPNHWNQSVLLDLHYDIPTENLNTALAKIIAHHDSLRLRYEVENHMLYYANNNDMDFKIEVYDLSPYSDAEQVMRINDIGFLSKSTMNIKNSLLFKAGLFNLGNQRKKLLLTAHHLVVDAVSWRIILDDLKDLLMQLDRSMGALKLPSKTDSFKAWSEALQHYSKTASFDDDLAYWDHRKVTEPMVQNYFVNDVEAAIVDNYNMKSMHFELSTEETQQLLTKANMAYTTQTMDLLVAALSKSLYEFTKVSEVTVELEGHGREQILDDIDILRTVGWFTTLYPITLMIEDSSISAGIKSIKEQLRKIPKKGIGYGIVTYLNGRIMKRNEKLIRFNYLGEFDSGSGSPYFTISEMESGSEQSLDNHPTSLFDIMILKVHQNMRITVSYSSTRIHQEKLQDFMNSFMHQLRQVIAHCCNKEGSEVTPADFETISLSQDELDFLLS
ncbi:non-ribosomal peptide synthetase [Paenibacillus tyrfis]|nr:non-ribosomal peptide synthetase [Paenibacillus tyrfis]